MLPAYDIDELMELLGIEDIKKELRRPWVRFCMFFVIFFMTIKDAVKQLLHPKVKKEKTENEK